MLKSLLTVQVTICVVLFRRQWVNNFVTCFEFFSSPLPSGPLFMEMSQAACECQLERHRCSLQQLDYFLWCTKEFKIILYVVIRFFSRINLRVPLETYLHQIPPGQPLLFSPKFFILRNVVGFKHHHIIQPHSHEIYFADMKIFITLLLILKKFIFSTLLISFAPLLFLCRISPQQVTVNVVS